MRKNLILIIFAISFVTLMSSTVFASQGINGGDECSGSRSKSQFCCTVQHSGSRGDCEDVVVNDVEQKCAFVQDISRCGNLPQNWEQAEETESWGRICPSFDYEWLENPLNCEAKIIEKNNDDDQKVIINNDQQQNSNILYILGISAVLIILMIIWWFFLIKRRQK